MPIFFKHVEHVQVVIPKPHPKPNGVGVDVFVKGMQFVVPVQINGPFAHHGKLVHPFSV
jgi:hypothetical protein